MPGPGDKENKINSDTPTHHANVSVWKQVLFVFGAHFEQSKLAANCIIAPSSEFWNAKLSITTHLVETKYNILQNCF